MPSARDDVAGALVSEASNAEDVAEVWTQILDVLRSAWRADRAVVVRQEKDGATAVVATVPAGDKGRPFDPSTLERALVTEEAVTVDPARGQGALLAVGLRPGGDGRWGIGLVRARAPWTAAEGRGLAEIRPHIELLVEHARLRAEVHRARERERAAAAEHERFLNAISHELRNPLAPILMWTSTIRRLRPDDADVQRAAQAITHAVSLERRLIEELLDLSRLERGTLELVVEPVDLVEVARAIVAERAAAAADAKLALDCDVPSTPVVVRGDRSRLDQVLRSLVENAIKFTPAGGRVQVELAQQGGRAELAVADTGPGLPDDVRARLFRPFVKGRNARGGLGLGLALARLVLELQDGTIVAASRDGGGTRMVVSLPLAAA